MMINLFKLKNLFKTALPSLIITILLIIIIIFSKKYHQLRQNLKIEKDKKDSKENKDKKQDNYSLEFALIAYTWLPFILKIIGTTYIGLAVSSSLIIGYLIGSFIKKDY